MANTYITSGASFKPYTFDEMIKPYQMYTEAYNKADAELNTLLENSALNFSFMPQDTAEKAIYDDMMSRLEGLSGQLAQGMNPQVMKDIRNINKEYRTKMLPIQQKIAKRAELAKQQATQQAANSNIRFTKDYSTANLSDITANSSYGIINLDDVYKQTAADFADITSHIYNDELDPVAIGDTGYFKVKSGYGYTPTGFVEKLYTDGSPVNVFYNDRVAAIKARTDIDDNIKQEMISAVRRGMEASAGTFTEKIVKGVSGNSTSGSSSGSSNPTKPLWEPVSAFNDSEYDYFKMRGSTTVHAFKKGADPNKDESMYVDTKANIDKKRNTNAEATPGGDSRGGKVSLVSDGNTVQIYTKFGNKENGKPYRNITQIDVSKHFNGLSEFTYTSSWDSSMPTLRVQKFKFSDISRDSPFRQYMIDAFAIGGVTEATIDAYYEFGIDKNGVLFYKQRKLQGGTPTQTETSNQTETGDSGGNPSTPTTPEPKEEPSSDNIGL